MSWKTLKHSAELKGTVASGNNALCARANTVNIKIGITAGKMKMKKKNHHS